MREVERVNVPLSVEYLFSMLFGKRQYHHYVGNVRYSTWKRDLVKTAKYIRKSIEINLRSDQAHRSELLATCDALISRAGEAKSTDQLNVATIESLIRLVFALLGDLPYHWDSRSPYQDGSWRLDAHRSLLFTQSAEQKVRLLIDLVDRWQRLAIDLNTYRSLHEAYLHESDGDAEKFLRWFKSEYPAAYCDVF